MEWKQAKLYGGELDGAQFELDYHPPPEAIFVLPLCENCGCYHHAPCDRVEPIPGAVTYMLRREDNEHGIAYYGYGDLYVPGPGGIFEKVDRRELVGV